MTSEFSDALAAAHWDYANDPATAQARNELNEFLRAYHDLEKRVEKWELLPTPTPSDLKIKENTLADLRPQLVAMAGEFNRRRGDFLEPSQTAMLAPTVGNKPPTAAKTHKLKERIHELDAEIETAKSRAINSSDHHNVWTELVKMADAKEACLLGVDDMDIKYTSSGQVKFFRKANLKDRMARKKLAKAR